MTHSRDTINKQPDPKEYLGDGAYARMNEDGDLVITAENGLYVTDRIIIEREAARTLCRLWTSWDRSRGGYDGTK